MENTKNAKDLCFAAKNGAKTLDAAAVKAADDYCKAYVQFLNDAKTEREAVCAAVRMAERNGFVPFDPSEKLKAGDKVYVNNRGKSLILATIGEKPTACPSRRRTSTPRVWT